jgi:hypothetical protein
LTLANAKARKLAGLLDNQRAFRGDRAPWIEALIFLPAPGISVRLPDSERMVYAESAITLAPVAPNFRSRNFLPGDVML